MFVDPHSCTCDGCRDFLAGNTGIDEPPGLSNLAPPSALNLERQTAAPHNSAEGSPVFIPLSRTSTQPPAEAVPLPRRTNGGGITPPPSLGPSSGCLDPRLFTGFRASRWENADAAPSAVALGPTPTGLGNWRAHFESSRPAEAPDAPPLRREGPEDEHSGLCCCGPCTGVHESSGMSLDMRDEITEHLTDYLDMLQKHQKVMAAKLDLYAFLLEDGSVRLRLEAFNKRIQSLKATLEKLE